MDVLILLGLLALVGSAISVIHKGFRTYWLFSLLTATALAFLYQLVAYLEAGYLDPLYRTAFVVSWIAFFGIASAGYVVYRLVRRRKGQRDSGGTET